MACEWRDRWLGIIFRGCECLDNWRVNEKDDNVYCEEE